MWVTLGVLLGVICLFFIFVMIYDSNRFVTVNYRITDPRLTKKVRLVFLTDLHNKSYGQDNGKLLSAIDQAAPDLIMSAGDLITSVPGSSMETAEKLVKSLSEKYPVYYGNGNHEYRLYHETEKFGTMGEEYRNALGACRVRHLENESVFLPEFSLKIVGLDLDREYYRKFDAARLTRETLEELIGKADKKTYTILLAHNPVYFESYAEWGADLVLAGHVHGGVMRLPVLGGVLSTSFALFPKYDGGLFTEKGSKMVLSRGLGSHTIPIRIFNPAELVVVDLEPESQK